MRKKILLAAVFLIFWASVCAIFYFRRNPIGEKVIWDMTGAFVNADGTEEAITVSLDGKIVTDEYGSRSFYGKITFPEDFRYFLSDKNDSLAYIQNQENDYLPDLMIFLGYILNKQAGTSTPLTLALDMEKGHAIALMGDAPNCYLVASRDSSVGTQQLMEHFAGFINKEGTRTWGFHERFSFTNCRITPVVNQALCIPNDYRDRLVSKIAGTIIDKNGTDSANLDPYSFVKMSGSYNVELLTGETIGLSYASVKSSYKTELTHYLLINGQAYQCAADLSEVFDELDAYVYSQTEADADTSN